MSSAFEKIQIFGIFPSYITEKALSEGRDLKKLKIGIGAILMALTALISDNVAVIAVYAASALIHELGHLAAARSLKIKVREIRFGFSGVRICTDERLTSYRDEFILAASGPTINFLLIAIVMTVAKCRDMGIYELLDATEAFADGGEINLFGVLGFAALSSALQGGMNLLPVNTFDGGRMLYSAVASAFGQTSADRVLSVASAAAGFVIWTAALYLMLKISAGLGIYVFSACIFLSSLRDTDIKQINSDQKHFTD